MALKLEAMYNSAYENILSIYSKLPGVTMERVSEIRKALSRVVIHSGENEPDIFSSSIRIQPNITLNEELSKEQQINLFMPTPNDSAYYISRLYYEIAFIFSLSSLQKSEVQNKYFFTWGICKYEYTLLSSEFVKFRSENDSYKKLNNTIADIFAEYFLNEIEGIKYKALDFVNPLKKICKRLSPSSIRKIIAAYGMTDIKQISEELTKISGCKDFSELSSLLD